MIRVDTSLRTALGQRLVVTRPVQPGEQLLSVPPGGLLTSEFARKHEFASVARDFPELNTPPFMLGLSLLLADARDAADSGGPAEAFTLTTDDTGAGGSWSRTDLLHTLPSELELRRLPVLASPTDLDVLLGTDAHGLAANLRAELDETYGSFVPRIAALPGSPFNGSAPLLARWRWALSVVWRCALPRETGGEEELVLAPLVCAASHAPGGKQAEATPHYASASVRYAADGSLSLLASRALSTGEALAIDFGARSNAELLVARGETLRRNPLDTARFFMEPSSVADDDARPTRVAMLRSRLRLELGGELHLHPDGRLDPVTVEALAILSASPAQLAALSDTEPFAELPAVLELSALDNLRHVCSVRLGRYAESLDDDEEALVKEERALERAVQEYRGGGEGRAALVDALRLRVSEQRTLETNLEAIEERIKRLQAHDVMRGKAGGKGARAKAGNAATGKGGRKGRKKAAVAAARVRAGASSPAAGAEGAPRAVAPLEVDSVPPLLWSQDGDSVTLTVSLSHLALLSPPELSGRTLQLHVSGVGRASGGGAPSSREFRASLGLWAAPLPLQGSEVVIHGSRLKISLRKRPGDAELEGEGVGEWPRLLEDGAFDSLLRRRGVLQADLAAVAQAAERAEAEATEAERVRQNVHWLEDKWARQGRAQTSLADKIGNAPDMTADQMAEIASLGGLGAAGAGGVEEVRGEMRLTVEQLRRLEAGVHPSEILGLEGGVEVELGDEARATLRQRQAELASGWSGKDRLEL